MCNGHIFEGDVELLCSLEKIGSYAVRDGFSLCDEFCSIELCDDRFEDFVTNRWKDTLVVV